MKLRYEIFSENKKLIRSTNKKGLPYTLAVNRNNILKLPFSIFTLFLVHNNNNNNIIIK